MRTLIARGVETMMEVGQPGKVRCGLRKSGVRTRSEVWDLERGCGLMIAPEAACWTYRRPSSHPTSTRGPEEADGREKTPENVVSHLEHFTYDAHSFIWGDDGTGLWDER